MLFLLVFHNIFILKNDVAKSWRDELIKIMTVGQVTEAQRESRIWFDHHIDWQKKNPNKRINMVTLSIKSK